MSRFIMKKIYIITIFLVAALSMYISSPSYAIAPGKIFINSVELNDFLTDVKTEYNIVPILKTNTYIFDYSLTEKAFFVRVSAPPFKATLRQAQQDILKKLSVTRNEACYLGIYATGPAYLVPGDDMFTPLPFCEGPEHVDFNDDLIVNGIDLAEALDSADSNGPDMVADLNLNGYIDATDISAIIQYYGSTVSREEAPVQSYSLGAEE